MPYSPAVLARARARLREARERQRDVLQQHLEQAYTSYPRLREIDAQLRSLSAQAVALALRRGEDPAAAIAALRDQSLALQRERDWILEASELGGDFLDEKPVCPVCGGEGYIGQQMCQCLAALCREEQRKELTSLLDTGARFEDFRLELYDDAVDPTYGISPRGNMREVWRTVRAWALGFTPAAQPLLLTGGTGLGKTFLSGCVARAVTDAGYSVVYESAARVFADFEAEKFGGADAGSHKYLDCDLLILDDLGTEMTTQFVTATLYQLINTRLMHKRAALVSTNLSLEQIRSRYGAQIYSRLAGEYRGLLFFGRDLRLREN